MATYITTQGTALKLGNGASPEVFTAIPQCTSIDGPTTSNDEIDVTHLGSSSREFEPALPDQGEITAELEWDENDATHASLRTKFNAATTHNFQLVNAASPTNTYSFAGFIKTLQMSFGIDDVVRVTMTVRITGDFTAS